MGWNNWRPSRLRQQLTLYVIEQNKRIEKLEKENEELKGRVASLEGQHD